MILSSEMRMNITIQFEPKKYPRQQAICMLIHVERSLISKQIVNVQYFFPSSDQRLLHNCCSRMPLCRYRPSVHNILLSSTLHGLDSNWNVLRPSTCIHFFGVRFLHGSMCFLAPRCSRCALVQMPVQDRSGRVVAGRRVGRLASVSPTDQTAPPLQLLELVGNERVQDRVESAVDVEQESGERGQVHEFDADVLRVGPLLPLESDVVGEHADGERDDHGDQQTYDLTSGDQRVPASASPPRRVHHAGPSCGGRDCRLGPERV